MQVTVTIPDEFVERLIPAGEDASIVLLEELVGRARSDGRIDAEEASAILGGAIKTEPNVNPPEPGNNEAFPERYVGGEGSEWIDDSEQVRLHAAMAKFIGCLSDPDLPRSDQVREAVEKSLWEQYNRELRVG